MKLISVVVLTICTFASTAPTFAADPGPCHETVAETAKKKWWVRRHPWLTGVGVTTAVTVGSVGYIAPVYPFDYTNNTVLDVGLIRIDAPGQSPAINALARRADSKYYMGSPERNRIQVLEVASFHPTVERPDLSINRSAPLSSDPSARNAQLATLTPEQEKKHEQILQYFAPVVLQDGERMSTPFASVPQAQFLKDIPLSLAFDGDMNAKNNPQNLLSWGRQSDKVAAVHPTIYGRVRESESHYFIEYVFYYPWNDFSGVKHSVPPGFPNPSDMTHEQDIEFQIVNVRKTEDGKGQLDGVFTFGHGYMNVWHPNFDIQKRMRHNIGSNLKKSMDVLNMSFGPLYQPHAIRHGASKPSFIIDSQGELAGLITYCARFGHAQMAGNLQLWAQGYGDGVILVPIGQKELSQNEQMNAKGILAYKIESWQKVVDTQKANPDFFVSDASQEEREVADGKARVRQSLPSSVAAEGEAATVLPVATWGRSPHPFAFPNEILQFLTEGLDSSDRPPSSAYIYNPDIEMIAP